MTTSQTLKIPDWQSDEPLSQDQITYFRHHLRNMVYGDIIGAFAKAAEEDGVTRASICDRNGMDRSQLTRLLSAPSNMQLDTISTFLLGIGATLETNVIFEKERVPSNYTHWLLDALEAPTLDDEPEAVILFDLGVPRAEFETSKIEADNWQQAKMKVG